MHFTESNVYAFNRITRMYLTESHMHALTESHMHAFNGITHACI